jgi:hypothetical protein
MENQQYREQQERHSNHLRAAKQNSDKKSAAADEKEEELMILEEDLKQAQRNSETYRDFCEAMKYLRDQAEKAVRDMRALVANKKTVKYAFKK